MDQIRKQVDRARRRLWLELFLGRLVKCWFVTLAVATIALAVPRVVAIEGLPAQWSAWWLGGAVAAGAIAALGWTWVRGRSELDAAVEIDRRFDLKERVASSLSLSPEAVATPAGQALMRDAERAVQRLEIDDRFRIHVGRSAWLPVVPAVMALMLVALVGNEKAESSARTVAALSPKALENSTQALKKRLTALRKNAPKKGLEDASALLQKLEQDVERMGAKKDTDRKQALVKFNNLAKQLAERRDKLGGGEELRRQLAGMKNMSRGPADKMLDAMKSGEWSQAQQELQKMLDKMKSGELDAKAQKQLAEQLKQLEQRLAETAAQRRQAMDDLAEKIKEQKRQGKLTEAGDLQQKLDKMKRQQQQAQQLEQLAQQLSDAQQAMQQGDQQAASQAMQQMMQQLESMDQDMAEGEMLDMALAELEMAKDSMACEACMGEGCAECMGEGGGRNDKMGNRPGNGMGEGRGFGPRPEERTGAAFRDSRVRQNPRRGAAVITGEAEGPTIRGEVREAVKEEIAAAESAEADALVIEQLPRTQRENAEEYFNRLRDGD